MNIRFTNLPLLLKDMEDKGWVIDSFPFQYNKNDFIVILKLYSEEDQRPRSYAKASIEFFKHGDINNSILGYIDFFEVSFFSVLNFIKFFEIKSRENNRDIFINFNNVFACYIPKHIIITKTYNEKIIMSSRLDGNDPNAIYCFDIHRNGQKNDGTPKVRSIENDNKARLLRPKLYQKYCKDKNLSFYFTNNPLKEKSDTQIMMNFANR